ncbi:MAG: LutB/LldF family L-lactate oxidation iron-sulfur protein [Alphaproteobacteria bacterium]|nr:LutB/LldF family L-lactate oxidation iron-sulfur protein [Alphaproteobacteria bacterium]
MRVESRQFPDRAKKALSDAHLQSALTHIKRGFVGARADAITRLPEFEQTRDRARDIKNHVLAHLAEYLERFEARVVESGGQVHWARDAREAQSLIAQICREAGAQTITKSKSMITEEIELNAHLEAEGFTPVETDLGEYIIQLRGERPSHIIAPVIHLTKDQVSDTFHEHHQKYGFNTRLTERPELVAQARQVLRERFISADVGITGANFLVAETGTALVVTNEGNADLTAALPDTHIVVTSIEKVVPTLEDAQLLLRLLTRSATGQDTTAYVSGFSGPRQAGDASGPSAFHVVLLDNGRSAMLGTERQEMLRCIRCGACLNHCPVYANVGGHAYGSVYPGPMGAVLTPEFAGVGPAGQLPNASTFCGRCEEVCPVRIPLPKLMRHWRNEEFEARLNPAGMRLGLGVWSRLGSLPPIYRMTLRLVRVMLRLRAKGGWVRRLPLGGQGWTLVRDLKAPSRTRGWKE